MKSECGAHAAVTIITLDHGDVGALILVHSVQGTQLSLVRHNTGLCSVITIFSAAINIQCWVMISIVLMVPSIMARKWRVVSPSALCLLNYNFLFRGLNLSQCPSRGRGSRRRMIVKVWHGALCVSIRGQTLLFQIITYCCGKMALSLQLLKLSSVSITRRTKPMFNNNKAICNMAQCVFLLIILTCNNSACIRLSSI